MTAERPRTNAGNRAGTTVHRLTTDELGTYSGRRCFLTVAVEPDPSSVGSFDPYEDAEEWCVTVHYPGTVPNESDSEIVRIDTSHGRPHVDKLFLEDPRKEWLPEEYDLATAERRLARRWREYAKQHARNHEVAREE